MKIDDSTIDRIKFLRSKQPDKFRYLRILVEGGGCAGFQYAFDMVPENNRDEEADLVFEAEGVEVLSDEMTLEMINGSIIQYKEEMIRAAFEVAENPLADSGCSCGTSFTPKDL